MATKRKKVKKAKQDKKAETTVVRKAKPNRAVDGSFRPGAVAGVIWTRLMKGGTFAKILNQLKAEKLKTRNLEGFIRRVAQWTARAGKLKIERANGVTTYTPIK